MGYEETRGRVHFKIASYVSNRGIQLLVLRITFYNLEIASIGHLKMDNFVLSEGLCF